jgi:DNA-binding NtrC family response regulator
VNKKRIVLVVDDEHSVMETTVAFLENVRVFQVIGTSSFECAATHLAAPGCIDVLVCDYRLWRARSGLELCEIAVALNAAVAIVLISAESSDEAKSRPQRAIFLRKPFGRVELLHGIKAATLRTKDV